MMWLAELCIASALLFVANGLGFAEEPADHPSAGVASANDTQVLSHAERGAQVKEIDACREEGIEPNAASPNWDSPAVTTQCGALQMDSLFTAQPLSGGVHQETMGITARFGLTPRLEVRWGLPGHLRQSGGGERLVGTTDQWIGACYRFHEQKGRVPDLAIDYAVKFPTANPAKGFGSGYTDHVGTFIASTDVKNTHIDFNAAGTVAGGLRGHDAAAQFGLAVTRHLRPKLLGTLEAFGGSQPGTSNRYGAALAGGAWSLRPWLAVNGAYVRAYTLASPRQQFLVGFNYTMRPGIASLQRDSSRDSMRR